MNEYEIAIVVGGCITVFWIMAYIFSWAVQWAWAWIDDSEAPEKNWLSSKVVISKWIYPVNNGCYGLHGYAKDKKHDGANSVFGLKEGVDYIYCFRRKGYFTVGIILSLIPIFSLIAFKIYPVTLSFMTLVLIAYLSRFARRHKKIFDDHVKDKAAHK